MLSLIKNSIGPSTITMMMKIHVYSAANAQYFETIVKLQSVNISEYINNTLMNNI